MATLAVDRKFIHDVGLVIFDKDGTLIELYHYWSRMVALRARIICAALTAQLQREIRRSPHAPARTSTARWCSTSGNPWV